MSAFSDAVLSEVARAARPDTSTTHTRNSARAQHVQYDDFAQQAGAPKYVQTRQYVVGNHTQPQYIAIQQVAGGHPGSAGQPQIILVQQQEGIGHHANHHQNGGYHPPNGNGSNGKRKFESRDNGRDRGHRQSGGHRAGEQGIFTKCAIELSRSPHSLTSCGQPRVPTVTKKGSQRRVGKGISQGPNSLWNIMQHLCFFSLPKIVLSTETHVGNYVLGEMHNCFKQDIRIAFFKLLHQM